MQTAAAVAGGRQPWVDHARGLCLVLIVVLHSRYALGDIASAPLFDALIEQVRPFRLPALFFVSGLFLARLIDRPWLEFLDRRVLHYAYFYALWASIEFAPVLLVGLLRGVPPEALASDYLMRFVAPHGPLWFIYALPLFFVLAKLLRRVPAWVVLPVAALVSIVQPDTGWVIGDRVAARYFYFHLGYAAAAAVFAAGSQIAGRPRAALPLLGLWAVLHVALVALFDAASQALTVFVLGVAGTAAVMVAGAVVSRWRAADALAALGRRSLFVYLAFPLLLVVMRKLLEQSPVPLPGDLMVLGIVVGSILGALLLHRLVAGTRLLGFLFERPQWARWRGPRPLGATVGSAGATGASPGVRLESRRLD